MTGPKRSPLPDDTWVIGGGVTANGIGATSTSSWNTIIGFGWEKCEPVCVTCWDVVVTIIFVSVPFVWLAGPLFSGEWNSVPGGLSAGLPACCVVDWGLASVCCGRSGNSTLAAP